MELGEELRIGKGVGKGVGDSDRRRERGKG